MASHTGSGQWRYRCGAALVAAATFLAGCGDSDGLNVRLGRAAPDGLYFSADNGTDGNELWYSDGTPGGTRQLANINGSGGESLLRDFVRLDDLVFFTATTSAEGRELWITDGTDVALLKDIFPGGDDGVTRALTVFQDHVYFAANDGSTGEELWRSDGTTAGTEKVIDLSSASGGSQPRDLTVMGDRLFFSARGADGTELYRTDGTAGGTKLVKDINTGGGSVPAFLFVFNDVLYFSADDGSTGQELWRSDGTTSGTSRVADINGGSADSLPQKFHALNSNEFVFQAYDQTDSGGAANAEPWVSDGTAGGTRKLKEVNGNAGEGSQPGDWAALDSLDYFMATVGSKELWGTDGTSAGTFQVTSTGGHDLTAYNGNLYYAAPSGSASGNALWQSDGSVGNATEIKSFSGTTSNGLENVHGIFNNILMLSADGGRGEELWLSDGTAGGTAMLVEINSSGDADIRNLAIIQ